MLLPALTTALLRAEATGFATAESAHAEPALYGRNDGKAIGTYIEQKFRAYLASRFAFTVGNSASGIDFPSLNVDVKTTSSAKPQSSCPYKSARQKFLGLGYDLLVFVYDKLDDASTKTATLTFSSVFFIEAPYTGDYQATTMLNQLLSNNADEDDLTAFLQEKAAHIDDIEAATLAAEFLRLGQVPNGYLTLTAVPQWRLAYARAVRMAGTTNGIHKLV